MCQKTDYFELPTARMVARALMPHTSSRRAEFEINKRFRKNLHTLRGPAHSPVTLDPDCQDTPSLDFHFTNTSSLGEGVEAVPQDVIVGCGHYTEGHAGTCRPNMGQNIGCEYSRICECLEYAPIDESRISEGQRHIMRSGDLMGLPKRFPYSTKDSTSPKCLVPFYLARRNEIYECNPNCGCGEHCKTRLVQHGRQVPLQIFQTTNRGWGKQSCRMQNNVLLMPPSGLRCPIPLRRGQFVDTYRGEIITNATADTREAKSSGKSKNSYFYSLDKFQEVDDIAEDDIYVVDGEYQGGPTRFMNHSCEPNCRQYAVSTNKHDRKIYELAFFATEDIPAGQELTFDYLDKDAEEENEDASQDKTAEEMKDAVPCHCRAESCRRWLWI